MFRIKTNLGYYYATAHGRYGRVNGDRLRGWVLCEEHADELVEFFNEFTPSIEPVKEAATGYTCMRCALDKSGA